MIERYMLSALQLDAIGRVCNYALEHPNDFMRNTDSLLFNSIL